LADRDATGFFVSYAANKTLAPTREQYRIVQSVPLIPVGIAFILTFWLSETPRWLISRHRAAEAQEVLARLQGVPADDPVLVEEFGFLEMQIEMHTNDTQERSTMDHFREIWSPRYRGRFLLSLAFQTIAQWSGGMSLPQKTIAETMNADKGLGNGITYYVPQIFGYAGVTGNSVALVASGAYGIVKLLASTLTAFFLVDRIGRRPLFLSGLSLQFVTHIYMAVYMGEQPGSGANKAASNAAIASIFVYAFGWSIGLCIMQSIYGTEMFPTRLRGICYAITMTVHWFFQFAVVRVTPNMLASLHVYGAYIFWAAICAAGLVVLGLWAPETKRVPLEQMDDLFRGPWYSTWKAKVRRMNMEESVEAQQAEFRKGFTAAHHVEETK
jgi:hypothetical protein